MYIIQLKGGFWEILCSFGTVIFRLEDTPSNESHAFELLENLNRDA